MRGVRTEASKGGSEEKKGRGPGEQGGRKEGTKERGGGRKGRKGKEGKERRGKVR